MERLLGGTTRNYLPPDWTALQALAGGASGTYAGLAGNVSALIGANAVLKGDALAMLAPSDQQRLAIARRQVAIRQALSRDALERIPAAASRRFKV